MKKYTVHYSANVEYEVYVEAEDEKQAQSLAEDKLFECLGDADEHFLRKDVAVSDDNFTYDGIDEVEDDEYQTYECA